MAVKVKIGLLYRLPLKIDDDDATINFIENLHRSGFFIDKNDEQYFIRLINDVYYLEFVSDELSLDTIENTTTAIFDPVKIMNECQQLENIVQGTCVAKAFVFVGDKEPYDNITNEMSAY